MADETDKKNDKFTADDADTITQGGSSGTNTPAFESPYSYPTRLVNDSTTNLGRHPDPVSQSTYFGPSRGFGTGRPYAGPLLVDENGDLTAKDGYQPEEVGYTFYELAAKNGGQDLIALKQFLREYTPYYGTRDPGPGTVRTDADINAMAAFFEEAVLNGKTWQARMLDVMRGSKLNYKPSGSGRVIKVTSPEDISRQYLDASFRILGRAASPQEMQSAIHSIRAAISNPDTTKPSNCVPLK